MYECRDIIQGDYPVYIPEDPLLYGQEAYIQKIHGGVSLNYWIPKLQGLAKKIKSNCFG